MVSERIDRLAREFGEFLRFVLLWAGIRSAIDPLGTVVVVSTVDQSTSWLGPVGAAVVTTAVYWSAEGISWRLIGRAWLAGTAVTVLSMVGFVFLSLDSGHGLVSGVTALCWWLLACAVGVVLTSPTAWRLFRDRVLLRPPS